MGYLVLKTEPGTYSWDDLVREGRTAWSGVANPVAQKHLRAARPGDLAAIYHTGSERRIVGVAEVVSAPYPDPEDAKGKLVVVDLAPRGPLAAPVTLEVLKGLAVFADSPLVTMGRLSVVQLSEAQWGKLVELGRPAR